MDVLIAGAFTTPFGMFPNSTLYSMTESAVDGALADSGFLPDRVGLVVFANAGAGLITGQEMIRAQTSLQTSQLAGKPTLTVENACASSSSALHLGCMAIESGQYEVVVVVGAEKMTDPTRLRAAAALATGVDVNPPNGQGDVDRTRSSTFMELYAAEAREYMERTGATARDFAAIAAKATANGALNPNAQVRSALTIDEILAERQIVAPLTRPMCSSISDGASALVLCSKATASAADIRGPRVLASVLGSGMVGGSGDLVGRTAKRAYEIAGISIGDIDLAEIHDAAAPAEFRVAEALGIVAPGDGPRLVREGIHLIDGSFPINPSGGLIARGHPVGATGTAQVAELVCQLNGRAGARQVNRPRLAIAENAGGSLGAEAAACTITILEAG